MTGRVSHPLLDMVGIDKSFPGVHALRGVDLRLSAGEVLALVGENGAGKSTLMKALGGAVLPDAGSIRIDGQAVRIHSPMDARRAGVAIIYQELSHVPHLSARENLFLGRETATAGFVHRAEEARRASELFSRLGVSIDPEALCAGLSIAQLQVVEIARALSAEARIVVMDEPSAALTSQEVPRLFLIIGELKRHGIGIIYVSHRLDEVLTVADRVMVMRDGAHAGTRPAAGLSREVLIEMMVGRAMADEFPRREVAIGKVRLAVRGLTRNPRVKGVSFAVRAGEILGLTGLVGAGRTEVARMIFGADRADSGTLELDGTPVQVRSPRDAIKHRIGLLPEDRKSQGLVIERPVRENFSLPSLRQFSTSGFMGQAAERDAFALWIRELRIKLPDQDVPAKSLSGGNQQKVVLAKWLQQNCDVIMFDEPTRGIDVGAKYEIYLLLNQLARDGKAIVMIASEFQEALGMCDRILVMHEGRISGEITDVASATQDQILAMAMGIESRKVPAA